MTVERGERARGPADPAPARRPVPLRSVLALLVATLGVMTVGLLALPSIRFVIVARDIDLVLNTTSSIVAGAVAALAWTRFEERHEARDLIQTAAFLTLFAAGSLAVLAPLTGADLDLGMRLDEPDQVPVYAWAIARLIAALSLAIAAVAPPKWARTGRAAAVAVLTPLAAFGGLVALVLATRASLPNLLGPEALATLRSDPAVPSQLPGVTILGDGFELLVACAFLVAALLEARRYEAAGGVGRAYMAVGLVVAAFAQLHSAIYPGAYVGLVTTGDVLRLIFYLVLLAGIQAETRADIHALRVANYELERLSESEAARAAVEERARLAREVHDGLAQDLWFAKSELERLSTAAELPAALAGSVAELRSSVDLALSQARDAFRALNVATTSGSFTDVLARRISEFADQTGLLAELDCDPAIPLVPPSIGAELVRIVHEALTNVRKHADATVVRVRLSNDSLGFRVSVSDNGRGFDPKAASEQGFGIQSMAEQCRRMGGNLTIESAASAGSTVTATVPLEAVAE